MAARTIEQLTSGLIDYAGLFPPAKLDMRTTVEAYARELMGAHRAMLGRIICPASRLEELTEYGRVVMPGTYATSGYREMADTGVEAWRVSVVADRSLDETLAAMDEFDARHREEQGGLARADTIEMRVGTPDEIDEALETIPADVMVFFELPTDRDVRGLVAALAGEEGAAKIRCGGVTPDAIPSAATVAAFLHACVSAGVRFKATAGLHHAIRAEHALTYDADAPRATMHGFINVFMAACLARRRSLTVEQIVEVLEETDPGAFVFNDEIAAWRDQRIDWLEVAKVRESLALSYGSCSFEEPIAELKALGWL